jgi:hypothetical protein
MLLKLFEGRRTFKCSLGGRLHVKEKNMEAFCGTSLKINHLRSQLGVMVSLIPPGGI